MTAERPMPLTPPPKRAFSRYVLTWVLLGLVAAGYLAALALRPDLVTEHLPVFRPGEPEGNQGSRAMSKALAELKDLRQSVSQIQLDLAKLRTDVGAAETRDATLAGRLSTLEDKVAAGPAVAAAQSATPASASADSTKAPVQAVQAPPKLARAGAVATTTAAAPQEVRPAGPIETGSISAPAAAPAVAPKLLNAAPAKPAAPAASPANTSPVSEQDAVSLVNFGPPTVKPAAEPIGIRISNGPSLDALRLSWSLLADRHGAQLGKLEARYATRAGEADPSYDLIAGPVKSQAEAKKICKALTAKNVPCEVGSFGGPSL